MIPYADYEYYTVTYGGTVLDPDGALKALTDASCTVDVLTYCRIDSLQSLTAFQSDIVRRVTCMLAEWQTENDDVLNNPCSSYSVNGVSASFGKGFGVRTVNGVTVPNRICSELVKTGLCYPGV